MYTPQESNEITVLRMKVDAGTITKDELKRGMELLSRARAGAHATSAASRAKKSTAASAKAIDSDALLNDMPG